jgi:TatD DNase family protein
VVQDVARTAPLDRILVETDAPYLSPEPYRGKINQSAYVVDTAECIAKIRGISLETLADATRGNSERLFGLQRL